MMAWQNEPQLLNQPRSSAIALPSFGSEPDGTNSTEPPSLVTAQSDAATNTAPQYDHCQSVVEELTLTGNRLSS